MTTTPAANPALELPTRTTMLDAFLGRDPAYEGVFVTGVSTTGIFCRPTCPAKKPRPEHLAFFATAAEALSEGYRPCRRCRPLEPSGTPPEWLRPLLEEVERDPARRWTDEDVRARGVSPDRVRRWFKRHHGMTFQAYNRARRLGSALDRVRGGSAVGRAAFEAGYESLSGFQEAFRRYFGSPPTDLDRSTVVRVTRLPTPLGPMLAAAAEDQLVLLEFVDRRALETQVRRIRQRLRAVFAPGRGGVLQQVGAELEAYFSGELRDFRAPSSPVGTDFQLRVWETLGTIPFAETRSYREIAVAMGRPGSVRAVGRANGHNALAIVVPCHRVLGSDGRLVGYGGGVWRKRRLLELEARVGPSRGSKL